MTDTDTDFMPDDEDEMPQGFSLPVEDDDEDWDSLLGEKVNFNMMFPPDGKYPAVIKQVEYRRNRVDSGKNAGKLSKGWMIQVSLNCPTGPQSDYHNSGQQMYIWLGHDNGFAPFGLQMLCNFLTAATGEDYSEREIDMNEFLPTPKTDGKGKKIMVMEYFTGRPIIVNLKTSSEVDSRTQTQVKRTKIVEWDAYRDDFEPDAPEPF
jgi:hypothetical protein